jgi:hypothetical protein
MVSTRNVRRADGALEIQRILNGRSLGSWTEQDPLAFEKSVVWLQPLDSLDFVRVAVIDHAHSRRGPLSCPNMIVLGYTKLTSDAPRNSATGAYRRRLFYLRPADSRLNLNETPEGAIDPRTILPGAAGSPPAAVEFERAYPSHLRKGFRANRPTGEVVSQAAVA